MMIVCSMVILFLPNQAHAQIDRLHKQAVQHLRSGELNQAEKLYQQVLRQRRLTQAGHPLRIVDSLADLARVGIEKGEFEKAERLSQQALQILSMQQVERAAVIARVDQLLAEIYYRQGRYKLALPLYKKALQLRQRLYGRSHPLIAESLNGIAVIYYIEQAYQKAHSLLLQAQLIHTNSNTSATPSAAIVLNNLGLVELAHSKYRTAIEYFQQALLIQKTVLPFAHPAIAESQHNLASVYFDQGLYAQAIQWINSSLAITTSRFGYNYPSQANSLDLLSVINNILGRYEKALELSRQATRVYLQRITSNTARPLFSGAFSEHRSIHYLFEHHLEALIELKKYRNKPDNKKYQEELFQIMQLAHISTSGHAILARYTQTENTINAEILTPVSLDETQQYLDKDEAVLLYFLGWNQSYLMLIGKQTIRFVPLDINQQNIQGRLQPLLESLQNPSATRLSEIRVFDLNNAYILYHKLLKPVLSDLKTVKHLMIIKDPVFEHLPFSLLITRKTEIKVQRFTQFSAYRSVDWIVKRYAISELPGIRALSILRSPSTSTRATKRFIAFGAPDLTVRRKIHYNLSQSSRRNTQSLVPAKRNSDQSLNMGKHYNISQSMPQNQQSFVESKSQPVWFPNNKALKNLPKLVNAASELEQMATFVGSEADSVYIGAQATESRLKKIRLDDYQILAFATHGLTEQQTADLIGYPEAALLLTPPRQASEFDNGLLTATEIAELKLNADWVILSACNTGVNNPISLSGLSRAFFLAGTRSLLVSYWNLESQAASELSTGLFKQIADHPGMRRSEALRLSMMELLNPGHPTYYAHPYFWAPFAIIGEGGPLSL